MEINAKEDYGGAVLVPGGCENTVIFHVWASYSSETFMTCQLIPVCASTLYNI